MNITTKAHTINTEYHQMLPAHNVHVTYGITLNTIKTIYYASKEWRRYPIRFTMPLMRHFTCSSYAVCMCEIFHF